MYNKLEQAARQAFEREEDKYRDGKLGYTVNGVYSVIVPHNPLKYYVRFSDLSFSEVYHDGKCSPVPDLDVITTKRVVDGKLSDVIYSIDYKKVLQKSGNASYGVTVAPHSHDRYSAMPYEIDSRLLQSLRTRIKSGLTVYVNPGVYTYNNQPYYWPGGDIDTTAYIPSVSGKHAWLVFSVYTEYIPHTMKVLKGIDRPQPFPLTLSNVRSDVTIPNEYIPFCAAKVRYGQTGFLETDFESLDTFISVIPFKGASSSADGTYGLVPKPSVGDESKALLGNGTWGDIASASDTGTWPISISEYILLGNNRQVVIDHQEVEDAGILIVGGIMCADYIKIDAGGEIKIVVDGQIKVRTFA